MNKKLIVNADDFGQSKGINRGIIKSHEEGIVTSASLMVRYPAVQQAAEYAKGNKTLHVGLHVDLGEWIYKNYNWDILYEVITLDDKQGVEKEVKKQIEMFFKIMGRKPTHIDSHQHVHHNKTVLPVVLKIAEELDITLRGYSKNVNYCGEFYGQCDDGSPYHSAISVEGLEETLLRLEDGMTELACHPGLDNDVETLYAIEREKEVNTLCDKRIREVINTQQIELCSFDGIPFNYL